jgi:hypothetical protein
MATHSERLPRLTLKAGRKEARRAGLDGCQGPRGLERHGPAPDREEGRGDAIVALSMMIGAMTLARIVADSDLSSEILDRAKDRLTR